MWQVDWTKLTGLLAYDSHQPMIFSSGIFLFLFLAFSFVYMLLQKRVTARLLFVTLFSYYFYYKSSGIYFFLLGIVTVSDFFLAHRMQQTETHWKRKMLVVISLCINLGLLCYFKYTNFFYQMLCPLWNGSFQPLDIFLPVGISFFPQLVAGPIVRARDFIPQIRRPLLVTNEMFGQGVFFIVSGLFKKAVISDYISVNFVERIFDNPSLYSGLENLFGVYGYALQIYCDFSGYSDMAIGIALLLGFRFPINFNSPYKSDSVTDFWHRWHISLSTWLRDYLYISLGGNRKGKLRTYINLVLTMLLGGLWHGASWNFVVWGGLHGAALALHKGLRSLLHRPKQYRSTGWRKVAAVLITFHFVCLCWIFFRNSTFDGSISMISQIFTSFHPELAGQLFVGYWKVFALMGIGYLLHWCPDSWQNACSRGMVRMPVVVQAFILIALIFLVIQVKSSDIQPFIYFQF